MVTTVDYEAAFKAEERRRKFMQVFGRHLGWGLVGPMKLPGVQFYDDNGRGLYKPYESWEFYAEHDNDREAAERAVIDKAIDALLGIE